MERYFRRHRRKARSKEEKKEEEKEERETNARKLDFPHSEPVTYLFCKDAFLY